MNETVRQALQELRSLFQEKIDELAKRIDYLEIENMKLTAIKTLPTETNNQTTPRQDERNISMFFPQIKEVNDSVIMFDNSRNKKSQSKSQNKYPNGSHIKRKVKHLKSPVVRNYPSVNCLEKPSSMMMEHMP